MKSNIWKSVFFLTHLFLSSFVTLTEGVRYDPTWDSLDKRPLPSWYDESKIGIFIHWGVFSVPSFASEWFWWYWKGTMNGDVVKYMKDNYPPNFSYADFAPQFTAELFDPIQWAKIFNASGARYVVLTSKHHEGFCNWKTNHSWNWNSVDTGPHRDLVGDLANAIRSTTKIHFGIYHSLFEWFHPLYNSDKDSNFKTQEFVRSKTGPELYELINTYQPDLLWSDGDSGPWEYWNSTNFLAWLYNDSPVRDKIVTNDRWGGTACKHGGYYTCDDRYNPGVLQNHKWENCMTLDKFSWGYRRNAPLAEYLTPEELIATLASTVACGGNLLVNVGPTRDGIIIPIMEERLLQMGKWLEVNGEAIYGSNPWLHQNDTSTKNIWYTQSSDKQNVYAIILQWPTSNSVLLGSVKSTEDSRIELLGLPNAGFLPFQMTTDGVKVILPFEAPNSLRWAWVIRMRGIGARFIFSNKASRYQLLLPQNERNVNLQWVRRQKARL